MERNRWAVLVRLYPGPLLVLIAPALLATELAILAAATAGGWAPEKFGAMRDAVRSLPRLLRERRAIKRTREVSAATFASWLSADLSSPYFGAVTRSLPVRLGLRAYWALVRRLLGSG